MVSYLTLFVVCLLFGIVGVMLANKLKLAKF